jgi:hypothetical protein
MRTFRYGLDPVFLVCALLYAINRASVAPRWGAVVPFLTSHFGDVLLIPCALPVLLWLQRTAGQRTHDLPPTSGEIGGTLILWAVLFEVIFPRFVGRGVGDPLDVLAYACGALLASFAWTTQHRIPAAITA